MDVLPKNLHVLASVFHSLAFRFGHDFVLIAGASPASKLHGEGDADVTAFDVPVRVDCSLALVDSSSARDGGVCSDMSYSR